MYGVNITVDSIQTKKADHFTALATVRTRLQIQILYTCREGRKMTRLEKERKRGKKKELELKDYRDFQ